MTLLSKNLKVNAKNHNKLFYIMKEMVHDSFNYATIHLTAKSGENFIIKEQNYKVLNFSARMVK